MNSAFAKTGQKTIAWKKIKGMKRIGLALVLLVFAAGCGEDTSKTSDANSKAPIEVIGGSPAANPETSAGTTPTPGTTQTNTPTKTPATPAPTKEQTEAKAQKQKNLAENTVRPGRDILTPSAPDQPGVAANSTPSSLDCKPSNSLNAKDTIAMAIRCTAKAERTLMTYKDQRAYHDGLRAATTKNGKVVSWVSGDDFAYQSGSCYVQSPITDLDRTQTAYALINQAGIGFAMPHMPLDGTLTRGSTIVVAQGGKSVSINRDSFLISKVEDQGTLSIEYVGSVDLPSKPKKFC